MTRLNTKKQREAYQDSQVEVLMDKPNAEKRIIYDLIIVAYDSSFSGTIRPCLKIFRGTASRPIANFYYHTKEQRETAIDSYVNSAESRIARKAEKQREKKSFTPTLKIDDILYTSWGYDQTNVDFFQIVGTKGCFVKVRQIMSQQVEGTGGFMCCNVMPQKGCFFMGKPALRRKVCQGNTLRISECETAWLWDGSAKYCSWYA